MACRNRWFTKLQNGRSFHGEVLVITRGGNHQLKTPTMKILKTPCFFQFNHHFYVISLFFSPSWMVTFHGENPKVGPPGWPRRALLAAELTSSVDQLQDFFGADFDEKNDEDDRFTMVYLEMSIEYHRMPYVWWICWAFVMTDRFTSPKW